jgi:hypothetical protein
MLYLKTVQTLTPKQNTDKLNLRLSKHWKNQQIGVSFPETTVSVKLTLPNL